MARRAEVCMGIGMKMRWHTDIHGYQIVGDGDSQQRGREIDGSTDGRDPSNRFRRG
jgi:hypothetical protein